MKSRLTNLSETWTSRSECAGRDGHVAQLPPHGCVKVVLHVYPAQRFIFYLLHDAPPVRYCVLFLRGRPRRPVRPASRHPPPAAARLGARPSRSPVGREPARRRAARGRAPAAEGSGLRARPGRPGAVASKRRPHGPRPHARRGAPPSDAKRRNTEPIHAAKAQKRERAARRHRRAARTGNVPRPLRQARVEARGNAATRVGRRGGRFLRRQPPPNCSRRSAKIQKVWLSCVAR